MKIVRMVAALVLIGAVVSSLTLAALNLGRDSGMKRRLIQQDQVIDEYQRQLDYLRENITDFAALSKQQGISLGEYQQRLDYLTGSLDQQSLTLTEYRQRLDDLGATTTDLLTQLEENQKALLDCQQQLVDLQNEFESFQRGIVWSYGTGKPGSGVGELYTPHMVEDLGDNKLLTVEQSNHDVIVIDKQTREIVWQFGQRGIAGNGTNLSSPHSARLLLAGPYAGGIVITELRGDHRVLIVNYTTKEVVWETSAVSGPLDAIYWDNEHIMVSDWQANRIVKIRLADKAIVWEYSTTRPFYLQKLLRQGDQFWEYGNSYGGDLLFGTTSGYVAEIDTLTASVVWQMGKDALPASPMLSDWCCSPVSAVRYGSGENEDSMGSGITLIADEGNARVLAVNREKQILWQIGGTTLTFYNPISWLVEPTYVDMGLNGNLLVVDGMGDRIYEVTYPLPTSAFGELEFSSTVLTAESIGLAQSTNLADCGLINLQKATSLLLTVVCNYDSLSTSGVEVHVYGSLDGVNWDAAELEDSLGNPVFGEVPFASGETVHRTVAIPHNLPYLKVTIENLDQNYAVTGATATLTVNVNGSMG